MPLDLSMASLLKVFANRTPALALARAYCIVYLACAFTPFTVNAGLKAPILTPQEKWVHHDFTADSQAGGKACVGVDSGKSQSYAVLAAGHLYEKFQNGKQSFLGPPNDVALLRNALLARGLEDKNIDVLLNGAATRARLMSAFQTLIAKVQCNDSVVLYLTGHGLKPEKLGRAGASERLPPAFLILENIKTDDFDRDPPWDAMSTVEIESVLLALRMKGSHVLLITEFVGNQHLQPHSLMGWQCCAKGERYDPPQGSLALFQAPMDSPEILLPRNSPDQKPYGTFSFSVGLALAQNQLTSYRDIARQANDQWVKLDLKTKDTPNFYATDPDQTPFNLGLERGLTGELRGNLRQATLSPVKIDLPGENTRGASAVSNLASNQLNGRIQPSEGLLAVMVAGLVATIGNDGKFSVELPLKRGDNTVQLIAAYRDRVHTEQRVLRSETGQFEITRPKRAFALLIGNQNYSPESGFSSLKTPLQDIETLREMLSTRYGMSTEIDVGGGSRKSLVLKDATRSDIYQAMGLLARTAEPEDSIFIYYAGHGSRAQLPDGGKIANWVPVNARKESEGEDLVSAADLNNLIRKMRARHVLLVADSCYSGVLADTRGETVTTFETQQRDRYLSEMSRMKSRFLMSSGGDEPVADDGGNGLSVFARALVNALQAPPAAIFTAEQLFHSKIKQAVAGKSQQVPQLQVIRDSGHDNGNFTFFSR